MKKKLFGLIKPSIETLDLGTRVTNLLKGAGLLKITDLTLQLESELE